MLSNFLRYFASAVYIYGLSDSLSGLSFPFRGIRDAADIMHAGIFNEKASDSWIILTGDADLYGIQPVANGSTWVGFK